ncbi:hypothetical protein BD1_60 [Octadecabacter Antarctic BD virus 1]|nr:hypothetical protein BD1_60 [Octadecabacter Antarctic BD virus 1]
MTATRLEAGNYNYKGYGVEHALGTAVGDKPAPILGWSVIDDDTGEELSRTQTKAAAMAAVDVLVFTAEHPEIAPLNSGEHPSNKDAMRALQTLNHYYQQPALNVPLSMTRVLGMSFKEAVSTDPFKDGGD